MTRRLLMTTAMPVAMLAPVAALSQTAPAIPMPADPAGRAAAAGAQAEPPSSQAEGDLPENGDGSDAEAIEVVGQRERGSVPGDIKPEQTLRAGDIRAYGVSSVSDLIAELAPQIGSGRGGAVGAPVILLNGRPIASFNQIRDLPSEAIERTEILPPEAGQQLGYSAEQRVVNIVLRRRFRAVTTEATGGGSTDGDRYTAATNAGLTQIRREKVLNLNVQYSGATPVYEDDRDIVVTPSTRPYAIDGNLTPASGRTTIDPALGGLTVAGIREGIAGRAVPGDFSATANSGDFGAYRTLAAATRTVRLNGTYSEPIGRVQAALNFQIQSDASDSQLGLASTSYTVPAGSPFSPFANPVTVNRYLVEAGARDRANDGLQGNVGLTLNGDLGEWRWDATGQYERSRDRTVTETAAAFAAVASRIAGGDPTLNPFARFDPALVGPLAQDFARSLTKETTIRTTVRGPVATLPAGTARLNVSSSFVNTAFDTLAVRSGVATPRTTDRQVGGGQARISVPLTSRRNDVLAAIGDLSINGVYGINRASDFGTLQTYGYGFNWTPTPRLFILGNVNQTARAPSNAFLTNPLIVTPDARVFDFVTGQTVEVTRIDGGNPDLPASRQRIVSLNANYQPFAAIDLRLSMEYSATRTRNQSQTLPSPTAALQAAFPERYIREGGRLIRFDNRPVNFARTGQQQLRSGITFSHRFGRLPERPAGGFGGRRGAGGDGPGQERPADGAAPAPGAADQQGRAAAPDTARHDGENRGGGGGFGGHGGGFGGRGGFGGGFGGPGGAAFLNSPQARALSRITRVQLSLYHTWRFEDSVLIRSGLPELDQLDGDVLGARGVGRQALEFNAGVNRGGYGLRADGRWDAASRVNGGTMAAPTGLRFAAFTRIRLRAFADFNPLMPVVRDHPWLNGVRVELRADNLFNARQRVFDETGGVPLNYQPFVLDPLGRILSVTVRKRFS